ncbi:hypothetical protein PHYSODRAFT_261346 [Phytophthora sojae]|uniref:Uncharacterized protein n=1 Tax=Phytophthora sojae (strain P6497) TaxID=1094619 RepID=G4ZIR6_PHYSP|nr:hypothetical protein PHYSODRAFT_261346 [Phytophthora sojae]EGZ18130.1 hypothetical protein PHYSODRAFT_261346 [Phytophthora sojae]|eukprot:XP_009527188.1 hypothetical protein PHYSODRAFT_261346 [Phytophthora sojae]
MAGARSKKDGGRGDGGRGDATRQSRRAQGLPAESHMDLDIINREARARRKAERDAKEAEDKATSTEPAVQDDQVSTEAAEEEDLRSESKAECIPEKQAQTTESAKASEGGANVGEPPAADRVSDSPQPEQEEKTPKDVPVKVKAEVIEIEESDAKERSALEDAEVSSRSPQSSSNQAPSSSQSQAPEPEVLPRGNASNPVPAPQSLNADVRPSLGAGAETADTIQLDETAAKNFVARQVYRWEQMRSGRVVPPSVEYAWPNPRPDFSVWQEAIMTTSDYLRRRMALENRDAAWIAELRPERRVLGIAQDLTAVVIPPSMMSSRECAAVIELIEWKQLTAGVSFKVVPASDTKPAFKEEKTQDAQAVKDDLLMDDYEVELLGQAFVSQCRMAGILALRSPRGSPEIEPYPKRPQYRPARPLSVSTPSVHSLVPSTDVSLNADARAMSVRGSTLNASSSGISDSVPSLIGPSGTSNDSAYATSFHTQTSRDSSSSSSLMSLGHSASTHMRPGLVMSVQAGGALAAAPDMGMFVTKTVIPARRTLPDQDDVDMAEVASAETRSSRTASRRRSSKAKTAVKQEKLELARSESGLTSEGLHQSSRSSRHDHSNASFEVRAMKEEVSRAQAEKAFAERAFAQAEAARVEAERRTLEEAECRSREAEWHPEVPAYSGPVEPADYAAVHEDHLLRARSDVAEVATKLAKQQYEADREDLERHWKERLNAAEAKLQRAEADSASAEAERARRAEEADGEMKKRLDTVQQTIQNVLFERERERAERELERDTALNRQKFLADQNRELRATLSQVQAVRAATAPHPATGIKAEMSAVPQSTTLNQVSSGAINDGVAPGTGYVHSKNTTKVGAAQLRATVGTSLPKKETAGSSQGTKTVTASKSSASKSESAAKGSASSAAKKSAAKKSASRRSSSRKGSKEDADPPSSDPDDSDSSSSDSSDDDSSSCDYSTSSSDDFDLDLTTSTTTKEGTTVWTYRPYINYNAVEKFSEDASVEDRVGWWEKFTDMAAQGSCPDKMKIRQLRGRMSSSLRDWYAQLPKSTRHNWKKLSRRFKVVYCRETPRKFFYRLNAAAVKAGIEFQKSSKHRERHLRRFIKKLKDTQLKTALQGQKFKSISEVEHAL